MSENYNLQPDTNSQTVRNADSYNLDTREHMDNGVSVHMCPNGHSKNLARHSQASQVFSDGFSDGQNKHETVRQDELSDTREQLEVDALSIVRNAAIWARQKIEHGEGNLFMLDKYDPMIRELLDRQAAITKRECYESEAWRLGITRDAIECGETVGIFGREYVPADLADKLTAERDKWRARAEQVQESYFDAKESRDKLQAELKQERLEWESERDYADQCEKRLNELTAERDQMKERVARFDSISSIDGIANLLVQFEDLTAERDKLQAAIDAMENGQFYAMYRAKCNECERLKERQEKGGDHDEG